MCDSVMMLMQASQSIDLVFLLDITVSMEPYAEDVRAVMIKIIDALMVSPRARRRRRQVYTHFRVFRRLTWTLADSSAAAAPPAA